MVSSAGMEADTPQLTPPVPEKLARWLLSSVPGDQPSSEELVEVAVDVYIALRAYLAVFLGDHGFDALWRRAIHLAEREYPDGHPVAADGALSKLPPGLGSALHPNDPAATHQHLVAAFTSFIALLCTFLGEDLGTRLISQAWPDLPPLGADGPTQEATQ